MGAPSLIADEVQVLVYVRDMTKESQCGFKCVFKSNLRQLDLIILTFVLKHFE